MIHRLHSAPSAPCDGDPTFGRVQAVVRVRTMTGRTGAKATAVPKKAPSLQEGDNSLRQKGLGFFRQAIDQNGLST